jgi:hypothetical protein
MHSSAGRRRTPLIFVLAFALGACSHERRGEPAVLKMLPEAAATPLAPTLPVVITATSQVLPVRVQQQDCAGRAERCLKELACPAAEAARLFIAADDAEEVGMNCFRFVDGSGTRRDLVRGRSCLGRQVKELGPRVGGLVDTEWLNMRVEGVGGPRDIDGVRSLIGCASHSDWSWCEYLDAKEHDPSIGPYNYCDGATVTVAECSSRDLANVTTKVQLRVKSIAQRLDGKGRGFLRTAGHTYDA